MALNIYKQPIALSGETTYALRTGARFISAGAQGIDLVVWYLFDEDDNNVETRSVYAAFTGEPLPDGAGYTFIDTIQHPTGLVIHVFEKV